VVSFWGSLAEGDVASAQTGLDLAYDGIEIMAQSDRWWRFDGSGITSSAPETLAYSKKFDAACLLVWGLTEGDEINYQVRLIQSGQPVIVRKMCHYHDAMWLILDGDPSRLKNIEIVLGTKGPSPATQIPVLKDIPLSSS